MAIGTYTELIEKLQDYLPHEDANADVAQDLVVLAESRFNREVRARQMVTSITPVAVPSGGVLALSSDFVEIAAHYIDSSPRVVPDYTAPQEFFGSVHATYGGLPKIYTILGDDILFLPGPDSATYTYYQWYYQKIPALSVSSATNWLLTAAPDIYLYGCLLEAEPYFINDERLALWMELYGAAKVSLTAADSRARRRPGGHAIPSVVSVT